MNTRSHVEHLTDIFLSFFLFFFFWFLKQHGP
jgi:hypothetical protein